MASLYEQLHCFCTAEIVSLPVAPLSSRSRLRGTQQGALVYTRRTFGPRPGSVARVLGVQSRAIWQVFTGSLSDPPSQARSWKPPKRVCVVCFFCALLVYLLQVPHQP